MGGGAEGDVVLEHADHDPAEQVDRGDEHGGHRVALDELRGAVHRAVEVGLARDLRTALAGVLVGDQAGVQVGVDRHLLAGHRVEGEAGGDLGHAAGAVGDDHELDHDQDQEHHEADDHVAADDELAEVVDHAAGAALGQDQAGDRHVDGQPEQRGEQQEAREGREVERLVQVHGRDHHRQRRRDVDRDEQVDQHRGQRDDQHRHHHDDGERCDQVGVLEEPADGLLVHRAALLRPAIL